MILNAKIAPRLGRLCKARKETYQMFTQDNLNFENVQDTKLVYISPNPARLHNPLLGIKRINTHWVCVFYLSAWGLLPDRHNPHKSKKQNREEITKLCSKFRAIAKKSGVTIARNVRVARLLKNIQSMGVITFPEYEKAEALLTALYYLQFADGEK